MHELVIEPMEALPPTSLLSRISDMVMICSPDGRELQFANQATLDFFGWRFAEIASANPWWDFLIARESKNAWQKIFARVSAGRNAKAELPNSESCQFVGQSAAGLSIPFRVHTLCPTNQSLLLIATSLASLDEPQDLIRQIHARFRSIIDSLSINLVLKDLHGRRVYANQAYLKHRNLSLSEVLGKSDEELFPSDMAAQFAADDRRVIEHGALIHKFEEHWDSSGSRAWIEVIKGPLRDADNQINGVQILFWDATQRKETEAALHQERYLLHALLDNVPDSIYFKDSDSRFVRISRSMAEKFGVSEAASVIGKSDADIFTGEHAEQARRDELAIMETGHPVVSLVERETWPHRPDTWCSTTKMPLRDTDGKIVGTFGVSRDITELIETQKQLQEARDLANHANRAKGDFLANMSHEIRTPMNGIIGMAELLRDTLLDNAQQSFLEMISHSSQSLLRIINEILDFSKIESGKLDIESMPFSLQACVGDATKTLGIRAAQKNLSLALDISAEIPKIVQGDDGRLRQVLVNLIGNAIKFTENGSVTVRVVLVGGPPVDDHYTLHFMVEDTGIGIPPEKQSKIFEAFSQADASTTRKYGGTGLGLSISSHLVELMGGRIWLSSEPGVGTTFHFTLPFEPLDSNPFAAIAKHVKQPPLPPAKQSKSLHFLLAEDGMVNRAVLVGLLQRCGHTVTQVTNGQQAIEAWPTESFDAILMDIQMPVMDGLEATQAIRRAERPSGRHIPIIAITAAAMESDRTQCLLAGMDDFLSKPIEMMQLEAMLERLVKTTNGEPPRPNDDSARAPTSDIDFEAPRRRLHYTLDQQRMLVTTLREETIQRVKEIERAMVNNDIKLLVRASHSLKSAAAIFEAKSVINPAAELERYARAGNLADALLQIDSLQSASSAMLAEIDQWIAANS